MRIFNPRLAAIVRRHSTEQARTPLDSKASDFPQFVQRRSSMPRALFSPLVEHGLLQYFSGERPLIAS